MKFNKWTLGLAAVGAVSLASAARAEETANTLLTALSSTTIAGYVDTSAQWNFGTGNANNPPYKFGGPEKADGFNLNAVMISLSKALDETDWSAGYRFDAWFGPDANILRTTSTSAGGGFSGPRDFAIRQAYVQLRMPTPHNEIDWKIGVFDSIIGYESVAGPNNPNFTRSYGHTIEPQTHTGILGTYRINDHIGLSAGIANTMGPIINQRAHSSPGSDGNKSESYKTYMGALTLTAPDTWGFLAGSSLYGGVVNGFSEDVFGPDYAENATSWYAGTTVATPLTNLRLGASFDYLRIHDGFGVSSPDGTVLSVATYAYYQVTEKFSTHLRGEYVDDQAFFFANMTGNSAFDQGTLRIWALTATLQYDLWANVLSRLEFRWDHCDNKHAFGGSSEGNPSLRNAFMVAANIAYRF